MGHIKEPKGVDFIINGKPLTEKEKKAISEYIKADKEKIARQRIRKTRAVSRKNKPMAWFNISLCNKAWSSR